MFVIILAWVVSFLVWLATSLCFSWNTCPQSYYNVDFITVVYLFIHFDVIFIYLLVWGVLEDYGVSIGRLVLALTKKWHNFASTSAWQLLCDVSMYVYCLCFSFMLKYVRHSYMFWGRCLFCIPPPPPFFFNLSLSLTFCVVYFNWFCGVISGVWLWHRDVYVQCVTCVISRMK